MHTKFLKKNFISTLLKKFNFLKTGSSLALFRSSPKSIKKSISRVICEVSVTRSDARCYYRNFLLAPREEWKIPVRDRAVFPLWYLPDLISSLASFLLTKFILLFKKKSMTCLFKKNNVYSVFSHWRNSCKNHGRRGVFLTLECVFAYIN